MADEKTVWKFEIQQGSTLIVLKKLDSMLLSVKQRFDQVAQDGAKMANSFNATASSMTNLASKASSTSKSISTLDSVQAKAAQSAQRMQAQTQHLSSVMQEQGNHSSVLSQRLSVAGESMGRVGSAAAMAAKVGIAALVAGFVALAAAVAASVPKAMEFDATLRKINALAGFTKEQADAAGQAILRMAGKVGKGPQDLASALYDVAGGGFSAKVSMLILEASAKAAAVGMTATKTVASAVTSALKVFTELSPGKAIDEMTSAVSTGRTEWEDFAPAIGEASLFAKMAGASFEEANAALSTLTNTFPSTAEAATSLKSLFQTSSSISYLAKQADDLSIAFDENAYSSMNFIDRLRYLEQITGGNAEKLKKLLGQEEAMPAIQALLTNNAEDYAKALNNITHSAGAADEAFKKTSAGAQAAWQRATASLESLQIKVTTALLPAINAFSDKIAPMVSNIIDWIDNTHILENAVNGVSNAFNYIVGIGNNVVLFFQNNKTAANDLRIVIVDINAVVDYVKLTFQQLGDVLTNTYNTVYKWVSSGQALRDILAELKPTLDYWGPKFQAIGDDIEKSAVAVFHWIDSGQAIKDTMTGLQPAVEYLAPKFLQLGDAFAHLRDVAMPVIERVATAIGDFSQKVATSGAPMAILQGIFTGIVFVVGLVADGLTMLVNGISNVITWFTTGGSNAQWLWDMFAGIGAFLASTFAPVWQKLVDVFQGQVAPAFAQLTPVVGRVIEVFQAMMPTFQAIALNIGVIFTIVLGVVVGIISGIIGAIAGFLGGLFQAIGGVIQIISGFIQFAVGVIMFFSDFMTGNWGKLGDDLGMIWQGVVTMLVGVWNVITGLFNAAIDSVKGLISGFVTGIVGFFTWLYETLVGHSVIPDTIFGIISFFQQLPGKVIAFVTDLVLQAVAFFKMMYSALMVIVETIINGIVDWFWKLVNDPINAVRSMKDKALSIVNDLASAAYNAGSNIVRQIADGIRAGIQFVQDAIGDVTQWISDHLPHSPAKIGPLRDLTLQGSLIPEQIAQGMQRGLPRLQSAIGDLTTPIVTSLSVQPVPTPAFAASPTRAQSSDPNTQYLAQMVMLLSQIVTLQRQSNGNATTNNVHVSPVDVQRMNQVIQSLSGASYESVARGGF